MSDADHEDNCLSPLDASLPADVAEGEDHGEGGGVTDTDDTREDSDNTGLNERGDDQEDEAPRQKKRKMYPVEQRRQCKLRGQAYTSTKGIVHHQKLMRPNQCQSGCPFKCLDINDDERSTAFDLYYASQSKAEQQALLSQLIAIAPVKRRRSDSNKRIYIEYHLPTVSDTGRRRVCKPCFLATFDLTVQTVRTIVDKVRTYKLGTITSGGAHNSEDEAKKNAMRQWLKKQPAIPSHYCRKSTGRVYLPASVKSISNLYQMYKADIPQCISEGLFRKIFKEEFNIGIHCPRKDKCSKCIQAERGELDARELEDHLKTKQAIKERKSESRKKQNQKRRSVDFDLEKVLNTPHMDSMLVGYCRRYAYYNESLFDSYDKSGVCYLWGEQDAKRGANEVAAVLTDYLMRLDAQGVEEVEFFSDSCAGQNRNRGIFSCLLVISKRLMNIRMITVTYLLSGHTEMTADSIHSTIERSIKRAVVWAPSEWPTVVRNARKKPCPYETRPLRREDVRNWMDHLLFTNNLDEDKKKVPWGKIRIFRVTEGKALYSTTPYDADLKAIVFRRDQRGRPHRELPPPAYAEPIGIAPAKYNDLVNLCDKGVIPVEYRQEYRSMPSNKRVLDELNEADEEDDVEEAME